MLLTCKRIAFRGAPLFLVLLAPLALSQSLAELAKKEKSRRSTLQEENGKASAYTNVGVRTRAREAEASDRDERPAPEVESLRDKWAREDAARRVLWETKKADYWWELEVAEQRLARLERAQERCQDQRGIVLYGHTPYEAGPSVTGGLAGALCRGLPAYVRNVRGQIESIRNELSDAARRLRIPQREARVP